MSKHKEPPLLVFCKKVSHFQGISKEASHDKSKAFIFGLVTGLFLNCWMLQIPYSNIHHKPALTKWSSQDVGLSSQEKSKEPRTIQQELQTDLELAGTVDNNK